MRADSVIERLSDFPLSGQCYPHAQFDPHVQNVSFHVSEYWSDNHLERIIIVLKKY